MNFKILGISPDSSKDDIKKAYYKAARDNHPDIFPVEERHKQHLKMMKINEAYMSILNPVSTTPERMNTHKNESNKNKTDFEIGNLKDPAYTYYKLGFDFYTKGQTTFHKKVKHQGISDFKSYVASRKDAEHGPSGEEILDRAVKSLHLFEQSYTYFLEVITKYNTSPWYADAHSKIKELEKLNAVYTKICLNLAKTEDIDK